MFVYLSKRIAIPDTKLHCISWNHEDGWLACGGDNGFLKILKLETSPTVDKAARDAKARGQPAPSNLEMNQALLCHGANTSVIIATWNESFKRLTTSDSQGLIVVWTLQDGTWTEEMLNNRGKSVVRDMGWNDSGKKICFIYEDGAVIVGSIDGYRIWGKEMKALELHKVAWSPDSKRILLGTSTGDIHIYDQEGSHLGKMATPCLANLTGANHLTAIKWKAPRPTVTQFYTLPESRKPSLAVCYQNGRIQIMHGELDPDPILVDTEISIIDVSWNEDGSVIAIAGCEISQEKEMNLVQFYSAFGDHLRTLRVPEGNFTAITWEHHSLRLALAVDSRIYFANIHPDYKWGYFSNTLCYTFLKLNRFDTTVMFWNIYSGEKHVKFVKNLLTLKVHEDYCVLVAKNSDTQSTNHYILVICNAIGIPMDSNYIDIKPLYLDMTATHVFVASHSSVYVWQYKASNSAREFTSSSEGKYYFQNRERIFHIDDLAPNLITTRTLNNDSDSKESASGIDFEPARQPTQDNICCIAATDKALFVSRESGVLQRYKLTKLNLEKRSVLSCRPHKLYANCDSTKLAIIDITGILSIFDYSDISQGSNGKQLSFHIERKDVWDLKWAKDSPDLFACMEKTKMYVIRGLDPEEPVASSGNICEFSNLQIRSVILDDILKTPDDPTEYNTSVHEVKSLRDGRELLTKVGIIDSFKFIDKNPHPRLWFLLAEQSLEELNMEMAEKAFVQCKDYQGIQFVKRLRKLDSNLKQRAEVSAYFNRFDDAEKIYLEMDRKDLALELRIKLGDWFRVLQILKDTSRNESLIGSDSMMQRAWNAVGDYFSDRQKWQKSVQYYSQAGNHEKLAHCYQILENYHGLENLLTSLPEGHSLLPKLGKIFLNVGMVDQSLKSFLKFGDAKSAIDSCVKLNQWDRAVEMAKSHTFPEIDQLLHRYSSHLLEQKKYLEAVELFRKANLSLEGAKQIDKICREQAIKNASPLLLKKLHVLKAMMIYEYQERKKETKAVSIGSTTKLNYNIEGLLEQESQTSVDSNLIETAWKSAMGYHLMLLVQRQLYQQLYIDAMITAVQLESYDDVIPIFDIYCLLALTSAMAKMFSICSRAFCKLEGLSEIGEEFREELQSLTIEIFTQYPVKNENIPMIECTVCENCLPCYSSYCEECDTRFPVSVWTGKPLLSRKGLVWYCRVCKQKAEESLEDTLRNCPLCHTFIE